MNIINARSRNSVRDEGVVFLAHPAVVGSERSAKRCRVRLRRCQDRRSKNVGHDLGDGFVCRAAASGDDHLWLKACIIMNASSECATAC